MWESFHILYFLIVWKFQYFSVTRILREITIVECIECRTSKTIRGSEFCYVGRFQLSKSAIFIKIKIIKSLKICWNNPQNWFHVKSELQRNSEISTLCFVLSYLKFSFSIDDSKWLEGQNDAAVSIQLAGQLYWIYGPFTNFFSNFLIWNWKKTS